MAALYGRLQGSRGEATRCGTAKSDISATLETWQGKVHVSLSANGEFYVTIGEKNGNNTRTIGYGNVDALTWGEAEEVMRHGR